MKTFFSGNPLVFFWRRCPIIVMIAIGQHLCWSLGILLDWNIRKITTLHDLADLCYLQSVTIIVLATVAICASAAIFCANWKCRTALMLPQQIVLLISAMSAAGAIYFGRFADEANLKEHHTRDFVFNDQWLPIMVAAGHSIAIVRSARVADWSKTLWC